MNGAAVKIQASYKGYMTRRDIEKQKQSATKIQAAYRGYRTRKDTGDSEALDNMSPLPTMRHQSPSVISRAYKVR